MSEKLDSSEIISNLKTKFLARQTVILDRVDSTQNYARKNFDALRNGALIMAEFQEKGRGRLGRVWHSVYAKGIYATLVLKDNFERKVLTQVTLLTSLSVARYLNKRYGLNFKIRWPNDLILENDKVGGVLAEIKGRALIVGIGLNINQNLQELPQSATSLFLTTGKEENRNKLVAQLINQFEEDYNIWLQQGFEHLRKLWYDFTSLRNKNITAWTNSGIVQGVVEDLKEDSGLIIRTESGFCVEIAMQELRKIR